MRSRAAQISINQIEGRLRLRHATKGTRLLIAKLADAFGPSDWLIVIDDLDDHLLGMWLLDDSLSGLV